MVSVIIPAYNEEAAIRETLEILDAVLPKDDYEIIVVDDGSSDNTYTIVSKMAGGRLTCISHRKNKGYGSAIVTGCRHAKGDVIAWYDADGQHRPEDLIAVTNKLYEENLDYCIGVRGRLSHEDKNRRFGKKILKWIVNIFAKEPMEDFNSGMRAFKRDVLKKYLGLLPARFGASTVSSFIMQEANYMGGQVEIYVRERIGKSTVKPIRDGMRTLGLIFDIIVLFRPFAVFGTIGMLAVIFSLIYGAISAFMEGLGVPTLAAVICIFGIQTIFLGIICAQVNKLRLERLDDR